MTAELAVVIPTLNESRNIQTVCDKLDEVLAGVAWEVIFVDDDSTDGTLEAIETLARQDSRISCVHRIGRSGLSSACIEGILSTHAPHVAIMDADLQHDVSLLPQMLEALRSDQADLVVGSRYMEGGGVVDWSETRQRISRWGTRVANLISRVSIHDPMSGYFAFQRKQIIPTLRKLHGRGFKILFEILASNKNLRVQELPYHFRPRIAGASKLGGAIIYDFFLSVVFLLTKGVLPLEFISFTIVGGSGIVVHLTALFLLLNVDVEFFRAQGLAALLAMTSNFFLNNLTTHRNNKLRRRWFYYGLVKFYALCAIGLMFNMAVAAHYYTLASSWLLAGLLGSTVSAVWNYSLSSVFVWGGRKN